MDNKIQNAELDDMVYEFDDNECDDYEGIDTCYAYDYADAWETPEKSCAGSVTSLVLGVIGSVTWIMPILAIPINVVGIVLGAINMKGKKHRGISIAGFIINIVFLLAAIAKGIVDIVRYSKSK